MKQIFTILILTLLSVNVYSQNVDSTAVKASEIERIVDKYTGKAVEGFNQVVEKITPTAEKGFEVAVKLQIATGVVNLLPLFGFIIFLLLFNFEYSRISAILDKGSSEGPSRFNYSYGVFSEDNVSVKIIVYLIILMILFTLTCVCISDGILHLMAPEWYAIESIIKLFK